MGKWALQSYTILTRRPSPPLLVQQPVLVSARRASMAIPLRRPDERQVWLPRFPSICIQLLLVGIATTACDRQYS